jgi:TatD DNase family protein
MTLVDSHCHLSHDQFTGDRDGVLAEGRAAGVTGVISVASNLEDARRIKENLIGVHHSGVHVFGTSGVHPHEVGKLPRDGGGVSDTLAELRALCEAPGVVAVGECGLDFFYDFSSPESQGFWFEKQLELAASLDFPVVVHCREAEKAMIPRVREAGEAGVRGVLHCFPGDLELLGVAMEAGWSVSFTGNVTFRSYAGLEAVRAVMSGRYFLETDAPYLTPVPFRGKRNMPAYIPLIAARVAELRGVLAPDIAEETTMAARHFFRLDSAEAALAPSASSSPSMP